MKERLQKLIASAGLCARRTAEEWIAAGRVCVNGAVASLGDRADPETDTVTVDGAPLPGKPGAVYLMLNKPRGYVTTLSDEYGRRTAAELVADCGVRVYPVGRLDRDSEGLLLFTNDGELAQRVLLELKDKIAGSQMELNGADIADMQPAVRGGKTAEATAALASLGYSQAEIGAALKGVDVEKLAVEDVVRQALRAMVSK